MSVPDDLRALAASLDNTAIPLSVTTRKAARIAASLGELEYRALFELHLDGVDPKLKDESRVEGFLKGAQPRWEVYPAFTSDRRISDGKVAFQPLEELEALLEKIEREMAAARASGDDRFKPYQELVELDHQFAAIRSRVRNRVGVFLSSALARVPAPPAIASLHPTVQRISAALYGNGHFRQAILDTFIGLVGAVREKSGTDGDGTPLMMKVFSQKNPTLVVSENEDEQLGYMWLFAGAVMGIRNPHAHRLDGVEDPSRAFEWLAFASALFHVLDEAQVTASK